MCCEARNRNMEPEMFLRDSLRQRVENKGKSERVGGERRKEKKAGTYIDGGGNSDMSISTSRFLLFLCC